MSTKCKFLILTICLGLLASLSSSRILYHKFFTKSGHIVTKDQQQLIDNQFDPATGAHIELEKLIKQYLPNPDSYLHISSRYELIQDQMRVYTIYTAIDSAGNRNKVEAIVVYHINGRLINLLKVD